MSDRSRAALPGGRSQLHLAGFMGSGKSTIGRLVARLLLWNFLDLDRVIERGEGRSVAGIFDEDGEAGFRDIERRVLRQVVSKPATVVALGGGTLLDAGAGRLCRRHAAVVWLRCPLPVLERRLALDGGGRPLWGDRQALQRRYDERLPGYRGAEYRVDGDAAPDDVAARVVAAVGATTVDDQ